MERFGRAVLPLAVFARKHDGAFGVLLRFDFETQKPEQAMLGLLRHMEMLCCNYDFASSAVIAWLNASACVSQSEYSGSPLWLGSRLLSDR